MLSSPRKGEPWPPEYPAHPNVDPNHVWMAARSVNCSKSRKDYHIKPYLGQRDGQKCVACDHAEALEALTVDHIDGNRANWYSDNLRLLCPMHNNLGRFAELIPRPMLSPPSPRNQNAQLSPSTDAQGDKTTTRNTLLNEEHEPAFRRAAFKLVKDIFDSSVPGREKYLTRRGLMDACMELSGSSEDAAYGYTRKLFAPLVGPLVKSDESCAFRDMRDAKLTLDEIEAKYPKEGRAR